MILVCFYLKDQKCQSVESLKVKHDVAEARLAELTAELLTITEEAQFVKVSTTAASFQIEKMKLHNLCLIYMTCVIHIHIYIYFFLSIQNEAETAVAENNALKTACQAAEKAKEESREKSTMAEVSDFD